MEIFKGEALVLSQDQMKLLKDSIIKELKIVKTINRNRTSYGYKHIFERLLGFYICNADFKLAMEELNIPSKPQLDGRNLYYPVSEKSARELDYKSFHNYGQI